MRQAQYRNQYDAQPRSSQFRNLRSSDFYEPGRSRGYEQQRQQEYLTTPSYSVHDLEHEGYHEPRMVEFDRIDRNSRRDYQSPNSRTHLGHTASMSNLSRQRLNE